MEPALAAAHGPGVPLPPSSDSDTYSDTDSDALSASPSSGFAADHSAPTSSSPHRQSDIHRQQAPTLPGNSTVHTRPQTLHGLPSSAVPTAAAANAAPGPKPIKRKPLSSAASYQAIRYSSSGSPLPSPIELPKPEQRFARSCLADSPTLYEFSSAQSTASALPPACDTPDATLASHAAGSVESRHIPAPALSPSPSGSEFSDVLDGYDDLVPDHKSDSVTHASPETLVDARKSDKDDTSDSDTSFDFDDKELEVHHLAVDANSDIDADSVYSENINPSDFPLPMLSAPRPGPPHLKLEKISVTPPLDEPQSSTQSPRSAQSSSSPQLNKPLPRSPGGAAPPSPFANLFTWAAPSPSATEFSSISTPVSPMRLGANDTPYTNNSFSESARSNPNPVNYRESFLAASQPTHAQLEEMEEELKAISSELASSIRREMDLEDLVDRLQEQMGNPQGPGKRSSDYFSDSGYSSAKMSESENSREEIQKIQRRSEQEKASIRLELTNKVQDERAKRKALDLQIKRLVERASHIDIAEINNMDANGRLKDLENTCGDLRRRLSEERSIKNNFEDLLAVLRGELKEACNERDNLRDEVVPQLKSRVEGLEAEASEYTNLTYESSKMQQELEILKRENDTLRHTNFNGAMSGASTPPMNRMSRAMSGTLSGGMAGGLSRSNSVATGSFRHRPPPGLHLSRSNSVKNVQQVESREALSERLKDVEAQRDALHSALKNLLERQELQNRENEKKIRILQAERERLMSDSPRRGGFERDIANLRTEINVLRRRAEDALEEKWQVEKGLGGLKMDLDRAEEEIALLRQLLQEKDILIPPSLARASGSSTESGSFTVSGGTVTSESLQKAYEGLQAAYKESLDHIKQLELETSSDERTQLAMERLERTLSIAVTERDAAKQEIEALQTQYTSASISESQAIESERALADELSDSARRVEELASQVQHQLATNAELRERLAATVARGDSDRKANSDRIADLQVRLKAMEDKLIAAQTASEDRVTRHEEEIASIREAHNQQLLRMDSTPGLGGLRSTTLRSPRNPSLLTPNSPLFPLSPRNYKEKTFEDAAQMSALRDRVSELEKALGDTETEMQEVVSRMSVAQIEVLNLQEEREAAVRETRRLQKLLEEEQVKSFEDRFKTLRTTTA